MRFETYVMRALWIIMWLIYKRGGDATDEARMNQWRHDYMNAGGGTVETVAKPQSGA